jgi:hypothetical protein
MGFFSKVWKGVKKTFKKIGKGIKKAFKSFGKFMGKIGILGTIALTLLTGGLGIGGMFGAFGAKLGALGTQLGGVAGGVLKGASWTIGKAAQFGSAVKSGFSTLTKGVTEFFGQTAKYVGNKLNITNIQGAPTSFLGEGGVWSNTSEAVSKQFETFRGDVGDLFTKTSPTLEAGKAGLSFKDYQEYMSKPQTLSEFKEAKGLTPELDFQQSPLTEPIPSTESLLDLPQQSTLSGPMNPVIDPSEEPQTYIQGAKDIATEAPGAAVKGAATQALTSLIMPPDDYSSAPSFGSYTPQFASQDYGAVQQGLSRMEDPLWSQQLYEYDALGQQSGGYGAYQTYGQKLASFGGTTYG